SSEFQRKKLTYFFRLLDLDRNQQLEVNDFSDMVEYVRARLDIEEGSIAHKNIADKATRFFHQLVADISPKNQQAISEKEWITYFGKKLNGKKKEAALEKYQELIFRYMFDFFDHNHDGFITKNEYQIFFEIFGVDKTYFDKSFSFLDKNRDEKISRYEILAAIEDFLMSDEEEAKGNWIFGNL
ncbi:MAG: EF-hand domain-containing protein, partial [Bacteroidota bacterium]